jgi:hypothetical protein
VNCPALGASAVDIVIKPMSPFELGAITVGCPNATAQVRPISNPRSTVRFDVMQDLLSNPDGNQGYVYAE